MANKTETRPQQGGNNLDRPVVLRKVMEVLSAKGFSKTSIAELTGATGLGFGALRKAFGPRDEILRTAIRFCADTEASLAQEPLRVSPTGREAILAMLEENVRLPQQTLVIPSFDQLVDQRRGGGETYAKSSLTSGQP
jgi:AcrR family transcriptional regulator